MLNTVLQPAGQSCRCWTQHVTDCLQRPKKGRILQINLDIENKIKKKKRKNMTKHAEVSQIHLHS